jgi:hypothetical protein
MKEKFNLVMNDQFARISLVLSLLFITPLIGIILLTNTSLPPLIPFFNSMPWGEERLAISGITIFLPFLLLFILILNVMEAIFVYKKYVLIARIVLFNCFLFLLLGLLAYLQILFLTF